MDPHSLDLFRSDRFALRPHQRCDSSNIRLRRMNHRQQYLDNDGRIRQRTRLRRLCDEALPSGNLCLRRLRLGADVQVNLLDVGAGDPACRHKVMERVINAEPEAILKLCVRVARRSFVDQVNDRVTQRAMTGKENSRVCPKAFCIERRDSSQRVVLACVAVTAEISHPAEHTEDGSSGNIERTLQLVEPGDETVAEEALEFLDVGVARRVCHSYDKYYHI